MCTGTSDGGKKVSRLTIAASALLLAAMLTPAKAAAVNPAAGLAATSDNALIQVQNRSRRDGRRDGRRGRDRDYRRHSRRPPRGWRRYSRRPSNWRRRGCIVIGPLWFCP
jgi:Ni/Co efflux regulator RcnB